MQRAVRSDRNSVAEPYGLTQMWTPALPNPIPAVEAASLSQVSLPPSAQDLRNLQHLASGLSVTERISGDSWKVLDCGLECPSRKDVGDWIRALVRSYTGQAQHRGD